LGKVDEVGNIIFITDISDHEIHPRHQTHVDDEDEEWAPEVLIVLYLYCTVLVIWTLSIVRYSRNQKPQRVGKWICFRPQVRGRGRQLLIWVLYKELIEVSSF
jgi:hypothetical protein